MSYETGIKHIEKLIEIIADKNIINYSGNTYQFYKKKIGDFLLTITLGLMPGELWYGEILVLDAIYYKEYLVRYLIRNTKLDSPSSTRYKMFDIYKKNGKNYFNLNLQILINIEKK